MASSKENSDFAKEIYVTYPLDIAIDWIKNNMSIDDIFEKKDIVSYVSSNFRPDEVFKTNEILEIAKDEGWVDINEYRDQQINKIINK